MNIHQLRQAVGQEIVDYNQLKASLQNYAHPRGKISGWLKTSELIRVKKGLYIFGPTVCRTPYSIEVLANLIYGPSAISLQYALHHYGLIPERVSTVTSITNKRNKQFHTPIGEFSYQFLSPTKYAFGIQLTQTSSGNILIATPEKALCDLLYLEVKHFTFPSLIDFEMFLFDDLRIDEMNLKKLNHKQLNELSLVYQSKHLFHFMDFYAKWIKHHA